MGCCKTTMGVFVLLTAIIVGIVYHKTSQDVPVPPEFRQDGFWGKSATPVKDDTSIKPFTINVSEDVLTDLKDRLKKHRPQESLEGTNFEYGFRSDQLKKVIDYWLTKYDWRKQEKELNQIPHFKTQIEGIDIHFIHIKPAAESKKQTTPLMMVHGWPGSFVEFLDVIPMLKTDFELIIPSIPGYDFSEASHKPGLNGYHVARIFVKLMKRLGHDKFLYHGGDWGAAIGKCLAVTYPETLIGYHTNMAMAPHGFFNTIRLVVSELGFPGLVWDNPTVDARKMNPIKKHFFFMMEEFGYAHIQATKPDTVGVALNNDPAGLAAYILEKFSTWTDRSYKNRPDGGLTQKFSMDRLLTNVMLYWINGCITSSQRFYKEHMVVALSDKYTVTVPTGVVAAANELAHQPRAFMKYFYTNITQYTDFETGGHFLTMEQPKRVSEDIKSFAVKLGVKLNWRNCRRVKDYFSNNNSDNPYFYDLKQTKVTSLLMRNSRENRRSSSFCFQVSIDNCSWRLTILRVFKYLTKKTDKFSKKSSYRRKTSVQSRRMSGVKKKRKEVIDGSLDSSCPQTQRISSHGETGSRRLWSSLQSRETGGRKTHSSEGDGEQQTVRQDENGLRSSRTQDLSQTQASKHPECLWYLQIRRQILHLHGACRQKCFEQEVWRNSCKHKVGQEVVQKDCRCLDLHAQRQDDGSSRHQTRKCPAWLWR